MEWKDIRDYEGIYQVSDDGQVRRINNNSNRILKNKDGVYLNVSLCKDGKKKSHNVHRLVADAFLLRPVGTSEVNHKDGNKHNNKVENLEWVTQKENLIHATDQLNHYPWGKPPKAVKCLDKNTGEVLSIYHSISEASRAVGKANARASITLVCQGLQSSAYGYKWEYA